MQLYLLSFTTLEMDISRPNHCIIRSSLCEFKDVANTNIFLKIFYYIFAIIRLPWNQSTPHGYALEIAFDLYHGWTYMLSNGALLFLFISICLHHKSFYKIFRNEAKKLNYRDRHRNDADHLRKMIEFHILSKQ